MLGRPITGDEGASFEAAGYGVLPAALSPDETRRAREAQGPDALDEVLSHAKLLAAAGELLGDAALPLSIVRFATSPGAVPPAGASRLNPHTHDRELVTDPPDRFLLCWVALQDVRLEDGPMWIAPGSHRRSEPLQAMAYDRLEQEHPGENARIVAALAAGVAETGLIELLDFHHAALRAILAEEAATARPVLLRSGDAVFFHPALTHGSAPPAPSDEPRPRPSLLLRYAGAGARLYAGSLGEREPTPSPRRRLADRRRTTPWGDVFDDYSAERLRRLGVQPHPSR